MGGGVLIKTTFLFLQSNPWLDKEKKSGSRVGMVPYDGTIATAGARLARQ